MSLRDTYVLTEGPLFGFGSKTADALKNANKAFDKSNAQATGQRVGSDSEKIVDAMHDAVSVYLGTNNPTGTAAAGVVEAIASLVSEMKPQDVRRIETAFQALCKSARMINRGGEESILSSDIVDGVQRFVRALVEAKSNEEIDDIVDNYFGLFQARAKQQDWTNFKQDLERLVRVSSDTPFTNRSLRQGRGKQQQQSPNDSTSDAQPMTSTSTGANVRRPPVDDSPLISQDDDSPEAVDARLRKKYGDLNKLPDFVGTPNQIASSTSQKDVTKATPSSSTRHPLTRAVTKTKTNKSGTNPRQLRDTLLSTFDSKMSAGSPSYPLKRALAASASAFSNHVATHPASNPTKVRAFQQAWRNFIQTLRPLLQRR